MFLKQFRQYLYGRRVTIRTDHGALRWHVNFREPQGQMARWLQVIGEYDYAIEHQAGRSHGNADGLSRKQCSQCWRNDGPADVTNGKDRAVVDQRKPDGDSPNVRAVAQEPRITCGEMRKAQMEDVRQG